MGLEQSLQSLFLTAQSGDLGVAFAANTPKIRGSAKFRGIDQVSSAAARGR